MWFKSHYIGGVTAYSAELEAVRTYAAGKGYTEPATATLNALNAYISALIAGGVWAKLDRLFVPAIDNVEWALINIKDPSDATLATRVNSCTFTAGEGFTGNNLDMYIDTGFIPSTHGVNYTLNDACRFAYVFFDGLAQVIDGNSTNNNNGFRSANANSQRINQGTATLAANIDFDGVGMKTLTRTSSTAVNGYNGTTKTSTTATSTALAASSQFILRTGTSYANATVSLYGLGAALTDAEVAANVTAFNTYLAAI